MEGTISQQTKLIDFLQAKMDQPAKKKKVGHRVWKGGLDILPNHNDGSVKTMVIHNPGNIEEKKMYIFLFYFGLKCRFWDNQNSPQREDIIVNSVLYVHGFKIVAPVSVKGVIFFF